MGISKTPQLVNYASNSGKMDYERADQKPEEEESDGFASCVGAIITFLSYLLILCTMPFSLFVCVKQVQEYERAVIFRLGRVRGKGRWSWPLFHCSMH